jgi:adenylate kinase family enzyme
MVYILTGIAKSGKTTLAGWIHEEISIPVVSTDDIMMMLHYSSQLEKLDIHASDSSVARDIQPYIHGLIRSWLDSGKTYLLEGVHVTTDFAQSLLLEFPGKLRIIYLGYASLRAEEKKRELQINAADVPNQWYSGWSDEDFDKLILYLIEECRRVRDECAAKRIPYIEVKDLSAQRRKIISALFESTM